jgi:hypothetical protein
MADAQHLDPHQLRRNDDGVPAVAGDRIDLLQTAPPDSTPRST